jgi:hypothetical protein
VVPPPPPPVPISAPAQAARLQATAKAFAETLADGDVRSLIAYWSTQRGVPPEFDRRLLAKSRDEIGRDLDADEKRCSRAAFADAVKAKAITLS